jgi:hypothetical protein
MTFRLLPGALGACALWANATLGCDVAFRYGDPAAVQAPSAPPARFPVQPLRLRGVADVRSAATPSMAFERHDIHPGPYAQVTEGINVGDVDADGRPDIVEGGDDWLVWYRNPDWAPHVIAAGARYAPGAMLVVRDMDGDGRLDVLTGRYPRNHPERRETVWFANTPAGWIVHQLSDTAFCHDLAFADFDGDGITDAGCDDQFRSEVVFLKGPSEVTSPWTSRVLDQRRAMGAAAADIDGDGAPDLVAGRAWYAFDGGAWTRQAFTELQNDADRRFDDFTKVDVLDLDRDGRLDVFATLFTDAREGQVWAFFAPADPRTEAWTGVQLDPGPLFGVHSQAVADFDGTGRVQVMVGETNVGGFGFGPNPAPEIFVYRLVGDARDPAGWERTLVDASGTHEARAMDMDLDGRPDIVGDEENTDVLVPPRNGIVSWWRNRTVAEQPLGSTTTTTTTTSTLPACVPAVCDDADPCTADACVGGVGCRHTLSGFAGAACTCRGLDALVCTAGAADRRLRARFARACRLVARAEKTASSRAAVLLRRAVRVLDGAARLASRAAKRGRLAPGCAGDVRRKVRRATAHFESLARR